MKPMDDLVSDSHIGRTVKSESICSQIIFSLKLMMFSVVLSVTLTLFLVFLTKNAGCLPKFSLIVQRKYVDGCLNDGLYGSERACNEYYRCENGIPIPHTCKLGEEWSTVNNSCVDRSVSDCSNFFFCPKPFGKFRNELHCDTFYACYFNQPYIIYCPPPFLWSSKTENCEWAEDSDCPVPKATTTTTTTTTTKAPTTTRKSTTVTTITGTSTSTTTGTPIVRCDSSKGTFYPDPSDCTAYYFCDDDNIQHQFKCPAGKGYDPEHLSCNNLELSSCKK